MLAGENQDLSLTEIADRMDWPKSTVHGLLTTLRDYRFVDQPAKSGRYRLGVRVFELGHRMTRNWDIHEIALPVMQKLNKQFGEMVQLAMEDAGEVLYLEKLDSTHLLRIVSETGSRLPMHCSGLGKVLLAWRNPAEVERILRWRGMRRMTANTITDLTRMEAELAAVREQGYAIDNREIMDGLRCVAAPIYSKDGSVEYAISVSGLAERFAGEYLERVKKAVVESAAEISQLMGYAESTRSKGGYK
jgi:DNA-binding IclR family transcriptional regulator